jgi:hypothetical protein
MKMVYDFLMLPLFLTDTVTDTLFSKLGGGGKKQYGCFDEIDEIWW